MNENDKIIAVDNPEWVTDKMINNILLAMATPNN
jgi:hypothetical protein